MTRFFTLLFALFAFVTSAFAQKKTESTESTDHVTSLGKFVLIATNPPKKATETMVTPNGARLPLFPYCRPDKTCDYKPKDPTYQTGRLLDIIEDNGQVYAVTREQVFQWIAPEKKFRNLKFIPIPTEMIWGSDGDEVWYILKGQDFVFQGLLHFERTRHTWELYRYTGSLLAPFSVTPIGSGKYELDHWNGEKSGLGPISIFDINTCMFTLKK